jgi:hypothetical protein
MFVGKTCGSSTRPNRKMGNAQNLSLDEEEEVPINTDKAKETRKSLIQGTSTSNQDTDVIYSTLDDGSSVSRKRTETESVVVKRKNVVHEIMSRSLTVLPPHLPSPTPLLLHSAFQNSILFLKSQLTFLSC